jgi:predicted phosphodiesterase
MQSIIVDEFAGQQDYLLISDVHWDNPKCDRALLKKHLDQAVKKNAKILINGDLFCIMQGLTDRRGSKGQVRPEHVGDDYFDLVNNSAIEFFRPYAHHILMVGEGNHESAVKRKGEFDILARFVYGMNALTGSKIQLGSYTGWVVFRGTYSSTTRSSFKMKYHHGFGGGGVVTKGVIQNQRMDSSTEGADVIWMGHVHEMYHLLSVADALEHNPISGYRTVQRVRHHIRTSSYKNESSGSGYHDEKGRPAKPLGGYWMRLTATQTMVNKKQSAYIEPEFTMAL